MIELKRLSWRNFLSYGNKITEYEFSKGITRVIGENGKGKCLESSTLINVEIEDPVIKEKFLNFINKNKRC